MKNNLKIQIYKGIIQYLLDTTHYSLKTIAILSDSSVKNILHIYKHDQIPPNFNSEVELVRLFEIILEFNLGKKIS